MEYALREDWVQAERREMNSLLIFLSLAALFGLYALVVASIERWHRDALWREYLHGDSGWIAPDGKDFHGRPARKGDK